MWVRTCDCHQHRGHIFAKVVSGPHRVFASVISVCIQHSQRRGAVCGCDFGPFVILKLEISIVGIEVIE
jgi:hypothetical protein